MIRPSSKLIAFVVALVATITLQGSMLAGFEAMASDDSSTQASATAQQGTMPALPRVEVVYVRG